MCQLKWTKGLKFAILIADAPSHGREYNGGAGDNYPNEDMRDAIEMMISLEIILIGVHFVKSTEIMFR